MKEIIAWLFIWLGTNTYLNTDHPHPEVVFMPQEEMNALYYQDNDHEPDSLHGLYNKEEDYVMTGTRMILGICQCFYMNLSIIYRM